MWKQFKCWLDRNWNLLFRRDKCLKLTFKDDIFQHNDIITDGTDRYYRCMEKQWYILQEPKA